MGIGIKKLRLVDAYAGTMLLLLLKPIAFIIRKILNRKHDAVLKKEVVFIKMKGGGSLVIALPSLLGLKRKFPETKFKLVCTPASAMFGKQLGLFDEFVEINERNGLQFLQSSVAALTATFRADTVISLEVHSRMASVFALFTFARNRISFYCDHPFLIRSICTHLVFFDRFLATHIFYDRLASLLGANPVSSSECAEHLQRHNQMLSKKQTDILPGENTIAIGHACSDMLSERMLDSEQWSRVFEKRKTELAHNTGFVFLGTLADRYAAEKIMEKFKLLEPRFHYINLCGDRELHESLALLLNCREFWGVDSGLLHFARLMVPKCVSFWGPTDPDVLLRKIDNLKEEIHYDKTPCSPCVHLSLQTPCRGHNVCIGRLFDESLAINPEWTLIKKKSQKFN